MKLSTLSSKNQITIPAHLLTHLSIKPGSKLLIDSLDDILIIKPLKTSIVEGLAGSLTKHVDPSKLGVSFDQIMAETKKVISKKLEPNP